MINKILKTLWKKNYVACSFKILHKVHKEQTKKLINNVELKCQGSQISKTKGKQNVL